MLNAPAATHKAARDLKPGDRIAEGLITGVSNRWGEVFVYVDGHPDGSKADAIYNHSDPVPFDETDLTDPDDFEINVDRIARNIAEPGTEAYDAARSEATRMLTRISQPSNISGLVPDDPRVANGRAKVGDNVIWSSPMHGDNAYEVIGKRKAQSILGHDGESVVWGETGDTEYMLRDIATGKETTSDLRQASWKRVPAPGDHGPAARRQRRDREQ